MIIGGYSLHLYCGCPYCTHPDTRWDQATGEFAAPLKRQCFAQAKEAGWKVRESTDFCLAPRHSMKKGKFTK